MNGVNDFGGLSAESEGAITQVLMSNREFALEVATKKAGRTILAFRRTRVFEKTFDRTLESLNSLTGFAHIAEGGFVPVGYFNPRTEYDELDRTVIRIAGPQYLDRQPGEVIKHAGNNRSFILLDDGSDLGPQYPSVQSESQEEIAEHAREAVQAALEVMPILPDEC